METYNTQNTCATKILFDVEGDILKNVKFERGCSGNLQALSKLVEGLPVKDVIDKLKGIECGRRGTSCADQLSIALEQHMQTTGV